MPSRLLGKIPLVILSILLIFCGSSAQSSDGSCEFDFKTLTFKGTALEQARCLLRKVKLGALLENQTLPDLLEKIIDQDVSVTREGLRNYLTRKGIAEDKIGGSLGKPLSRGRSNDKDAPLARYFVIHDTSYPNLCKVKEFPANINELTWTFQNTRWNDIETHAGSGQAHLYITRTGDSVAPQGRTFGIPWRATSLEKKDVRSRGMFLHVENVQPRHCNNVWVDDGRCRMIKVKNKKTGKLEDVCNNDNAAPDPGLTDAQLEKLALAYVAASVRRGKWLIPAFHAAVDKGISGAHDDPQNFDLRKWADKICLIIKESGAQCPIGD